MPDPVLVELLRRGDLTLVRSETVGGIGLRRDIDGEPVGPWCRSRCASSPRSKLGRSGHAKQRPPRRNRRPWRSMLDTVALSGVGSVLYPGSTREAAGHEQR